MSQKILVIDDSLATAKAAEAVLAQNFTNLDILTAQRGGEGFERFLINQPDLILLNESLPDMDGEAICYRLLNDQNTSNVPVVVMTTNGHARMFEEKYANVVKTISKPVTHEALESTLSSALKQIKPQPNPASTILFRDPGSVVFAAHTHFFSLRNALQMAAGDKLNGLLRIFINRFPIELFVSKGKFLFATARNFQLYMRDSPVILNTTNLGLIMEAQTNQMVTGCPLFLYLATRGGFPHEDVVQITRDHGQRLFSHLWTAGRVNFEFVALPQFPDFARNFPPGDEDPENWALASLRYVKFENLSAAQRPDPNGSPAYTRKGYELIQKLKLNDVEARFATSINGAESLQTIAKKIGLPLNDALLIVFRFQVLDIIDYWSSTVLSLPPAHTNPGGEATAG